MFTAVVGTAIGVPAALFPIMPSLTGFQICFFFLLLAGTLCAVVASTAVAVLLPNEERGATMSAFGIVNALVGLAALVLMRRELVWRKLLFPQAVLVILALLGGLNLVIFETAKTGSWRSRVARRCTVPTPRQVAATRSELYFAVLKEIQAKKIRITASPAA